MPSTGGRRGRSRSRIKSENNSNDQNSKLSTPFVKPENDSTSTTGGKRKNKSKENKMNKLPKNADNVELISVKNSLQNDLTSNKSEDEDSSNYSSTIATVTPVIQKIDPNVKSTIKYSSKDNGPFVVYAKLEKIKEVTLARDLKKVGISNIHNIYKINDNIMKIVFKDKTNANKTIDINSTSNYNYEFYIPEMYTTTYGVIRGVELEIDIQEIIDNIKAEVQITSIERLKTFDVTTKQLKETATIKIGFRASYLPRRIILFDGLIKEVNFFLPRPMFCTSCVNYGHMKKKCRSKIKRCPICGDDISDNDQHTCLGPNCRFCITNHTTNSKDCEERKIQIKIRNTMTIKKTTYRDAKKAVAEKLNLNFERDVTQFPNLSLNTSRLNNLNKMNDVINGLKSKYESLIKIIDDIKQKLSNVIPNHPGNDQILIDILLIMREHEDKSIPPNQSN